MKSADQFQWESAVRRLIVLIAVLCTLAPLVLYLLFSLGEQKISMSAEADIFAHTINDEINNNPDYWKYEDIRFASILRHRLYDTDDQEYRQLLDNDYKVVAENEASLQPPLITVEVRVLDAGAPVGILKITRSIRAILKKSTLRSPGILRPSCFSSQGLEIGLCRIACGKRTSDRYAPVHYRRSYHHRCLFTNPFL